VQTDGKVILGGALNYHPVESYIARVNRDGSLDTTFEPSTRGAGEVAYAVAVDGDGKILIGGSLESYKGVGRSGIARINANGSLDTTFDPGTGTNNALRAITLQPDGKTIIGGLFTTYNGTARRFIARLNADGSLDTTFDPGTGLNSVVLALALQSDGKIIIGGSFENYNGVARNHIARVNSNGSLDTTFDPGTGAEIEEVIAVAVQADGEIIIGGRFTSYNGVARNRIARVTQNGSLDTTFDPGTGVEPADVRALAVDFNGEIIIGGQFTTITAWRAIA